MRDIYVHKNYAKHWPGSKVKISSMRCRWGFLLFLCFFSLTFWNKYLQWLTHTHTDLLVTELLDRRLVDDRTARAAGRRRHRGAGRRGAGRGRRALPGWLRPWWFGCQGDGLALDDLLEVGPQHVLSVRLTQPPQKQLIHLQLQYRLQRHGNTLTTSTGSPSNTITKSIATLCLVTSQRLGYNTLSSFLQC